MADTQQTPRVAIVHDWLVGGGAELVVEQLHKMFPEAPIFTSYCTPEWRRRLDNKVRTGWLQYLGSVRKFIPILRIWWFTHLDFHDYDLVISSSGAEAKSIKVPTNTLHVNYCHAPTHYYWSRYDTYLQRPGFPRGLNWLARLGLMLLVAPLRRWDYKAAQRPDIMIANSTHIQHEIKKYYGRDAAVVFPPVSVERFQKPHNQNLKRHGFLVAGRQTPYKRFDLAVEACTKLNLSLTVAGDGPDHARLRKLAGPSVTFLGRVSDEVFEEEFASAQAFIFPTDTEDFGITPIEAMAAGTPVIAYKAGGPLDYVIPGKTGEFFARPNATALAQTLATFDPSRYNRNALRAYAASFSPKQFQRNMRSVLSAAIAAHQNQKAAGEQ
ncbi:MAG TPA: glycosyltransferase [Candidatus Saccharimonadales bacterium]